MIKLIENLTPEFLRCCENSAFGTKILATALSYGFNHKIASYWMSETAFCLWGDNLTISGEITDIEESRSFIDLISPKTVLCNGKNAVNLKLYPTEYGQVLEKDITASAFKKLESIYSEDAKEIFDLFKSRNMIADFEAFYLDFSHKLRHKCGALASVRDKLSLVSCALSVYATDKSAIITAIATAHGYERNGIGERAVKNCETELSGRKIYIFKENEQNDTFYEKLNYHFNENWVCSKFQ